MYNTTLPKDHERNTIMLYCIIQGNTQKFWEDDILKKLGKM